jgi:hypothetical protein
MASYRQLQSTYPYFCQSGPSNNLDTSINDIATSTTFWNGGTNLERGSASVTTNTVNGLVFTAPVKGLYYFKIILNCLNQSATGNNDGTWGFTITKGSTPSNRSITDNPGNISTTTTQYNTQFSTIVFLNSADTVKMYSSGLTDTETYLANKCFFMGYLIAGFD